MTKGKVKVSNSLMYPTSDQWAPSALKTVSSHDGHSCGWFWHEALIWGQIQLGKLQTLRPELRIQLRNFSVTTVFFQWEPLKSKKL